MQILYIFLYIVLFNISQCQKIENLQLQGNTIISQEEFIKLLPKKIIGNDLSNELSHKIITTILKNKFFNNAQLKLKGSTLIIKVEESKFIKEIKLPAMFPQPAQAQIKKLLKYKTYLQESDIQNNTTIISEAANQIDANQEIICTLEKIYDKDGNIKYNHYNLIYTLTNLNPSVVGDITISGNHHIKSAIIKQCLYVVKPKKSITQAIIKYIPLRITKKFKQQPPFNPQSIHTAIENIKSFYISQGFFNIKVDYNIYKKKDKININIIINENKKHYIGKIKINNNSNITIPEKILKSIMKFRNKKSNNSNISEPNMILTKYLHNEGYKHLAVETLHGIDKNRIHLTLNITHVDKNYIQNIVIIGNKTVQTQVILKAINITPGEIIINEDMNKIQSNLIKTKLFTSAQSIIKNNILYINVKESSSIKQSFQILPTSFPPTVLIKYDDLNTDGLGNNFCMDIKIQNNNTNLTLFRTLKNNIFTSKPGISFSTNALTGLRLKNYLPYFKSELYDDIYKNSNNNITTTQETIKKLIHNQYIISTKKRIDASFKKHPLADTKLDFYNAKGEKVNESIYNKQKISDLELYNIAMGGKRKEEYKERNKEINKELQTLDFIIFNQFSIDVTKKLVFYLTPKLIYKYKSAPLPLKRFHNLSLFHNLYFANDFGFTYQNISYKNITPHGNIFNFTITPILEFTNKKSLNLKLELFNSFKFSLNENSYIQNSTKIGYIFNLRKKVIPYDHLFSLNVVTGFQKGGGYDIISKQPIQGQFMMSNVLSFNKKINVLPLAPIINSLDATLFFAIGKLYNNNHLKNQSIIGNNSIHASVGIQFAIQSLFLPPIYIVFPFDIINPVKKNSNSFKKFLYSVGEKIV